MEARRPGALILMGVWYDVQTADTTRKENKDASETTARGSWPSGAQQKKLSKVVYGRRIAS
jgi:hypothetical protein